MIVRLWLLCACACDYVRVCDCVRAHAFETPLWWPYALSYTFNCIYLLASRVVMAACCYYVVELPRVWQSSIVTVHVSLLRWWRETSTTKRSIGASRGFQRGRFTPPYCPNQIWHFHVAALGGLLLTNLAPRRHLKMWYFFFFGHTNFQTCIPTCTTPSSSENPGSATGYWQHTQQNMYWGHCDWGPTTLL